MIRSNFLIRFLVPAIVVLALALPWGLVVAQGGQTHTVLSGETLGSIAQRYGVTVQALMSANGIVNPNVIYAGQALVIPGGGGFGIGGPVTAVATGGATYTVQPGDTLYSIALRYNVTTQALMSANGIANPNVIYAGQALAIPSGGGGGGGWSPPAYAGLSGMSLSANAYLDAGAAQLLGAIPRGTPLVALARSPRTGSHMMLVQGEGFVVWVAYPWTTISEGQFNSLPQADDVFLPQLLCYATFCNTQVLNGNPIGGPVQVAGAGGVTSPASGGTTAVAAPGSNLQYVDNSHVRILFNQDNIAEGWTELRVELCGSPEATHNCEPVLRMYDGGVLVQPVRVENGYPVYRLGYHLYDRMRMESSHFWAQQLWITHPYDDRSD